uniref:Putative secreted protein n=1 Tax=Ixodes ricinus TaxID=34613 RepID=A0A6B0TX71_IXORI
MTVEGLRSSCLAPLALMLVASVTTALLTSSSSARYLRVLAFIWMRYGLGAERASSWSSWRTSLAWSSLRCTSRSWVFLLSPL